MNAPLKTLPELLESIETHTTPAGIILLDPPALKPKRRPSDRKRIAKPTRAMKREAMAEASKLAGRPLTSWKAARKWLKRNSKLRHA